jgi:outer membrane protein OmpA-like peptidoglycan-associated protein
MGLAASLLLAASACAGARSDASAAGPSRGATQATGDNGPAAGSAPVEPPARPGPDEDGLLGAEDRCPCHAEDLDFFEDADGCPDPDNDADGIVDPCDECPLDPEDFDECADEDGCPDRTLVRIISCSIRIDEEVRFRRNSTRIEPVSEDLLDAVASVMADYPRFTAIALTGHADPGERDPAGLSRRRAEAVRDELVARGVEAERLRVEARGDAEALETGGDDPARNRRVTFRLLEIDHQPVAAPEPDPGEPPPQPCDAEPLCPDGPPPPPPDRCAEEAG